MNTSTKLSAKTLMQLLATAMIILTLFSCGGGGDDATTPPTTNPTTPTVTPTIISANAARVSILSALATGTPSQVAISWGQVAGATSYKLYKSTTTLSGYKNASPANLSTSSTVTVTTHTSNASTITTNITLSDAQTAYFLVTAIKNTVESFTNATQTVATAFAMPFLTVVSTGTGLFKNITPTYRVWMDRNLGASRVATSSTDTLAYGDLYQWGRPADGHQVSTTTIASTTTRVDNITPTHGQFITGTDEYADWTTVDGSGTLRSAYWGRIDGSSICPTGFRVPTDAELVAESGSWFYTSTRSAFVENIKLPAAGQRDKDDAAFSKGGSGGYLWSMTPLQTGNVKSEYLYFNAGSIGAGPKSRSYGYSVRCIKPE